MRMLQRLRALAVCSLILVALATSAARAQVVFDNVTNPTGAKSFTALQIGNEVQIAAPAVLTTLEIGVTSQGTPLTVSSLQAFLYLNDGTGGQPGTQLWASAPMLNVALTGGNDLVPFAVPAISVPNIFTWTIQVGASTPVATGLPGFDPPSIGAILHSWFGGPPTWTSLDSSGANGHFMARISAGPAAVPEPGPMTLVLCIAAGSLALLRKPRRA